MRWSAPDLEQFERSNGFQLPEEYALFLTVFGTGGPGPDNGLRQLLPGILGNYERSLASLPFPYTAREIEEHIEALRRGRRCFARGLSKGVLRITEPKEAEYDEDLGDCYCYPSYIVISGEQRGTIWQPFYRGPKGMGVRPMFTRNGELATFRW
jgi:hypothetical protein